MFCKCQTRRRRLIIVCIILALLAGGIAWWQLSNDDAPKRRSIGNGILASGPDANKLTANRTTATTEPFVTTVTDPYDVTVEGELSGQGKLTNPVTLYLPSTAKPGDTVMLASKDPGKPWEYLGPQDGVKVVTIGDEHYVKATVSHLSIKLGFSPIYWLQERWEESIQKFSGGLLKEIKQPTCNDNITAQNRGYRLRVMQKNVLFGCLDYKNNKGQVRLTNRKGYPVTVWHKGFEVTQKPPFQISVAAMSKLDNAEHTTLMPGETMTVAKAVKPGEEAKIIAEYGRAAQAMTRFDVSIKALAEMYDIMKGGGTKSRYLKAAQVFLQGTDCINAIKAGNIVESVSKCFPASAVDKFKEVFGLEGMILAPVLAIYGLIDWTTAEISAVIDEAKGDDKAYIGLVRLAQPKYKLPHQCADYGGGDTVTIMKGTVTCDEAIEVALSYNRDSKNPRDITAKDCAGANGKPCTHITGTWHCYGGEGLTGCDKGDNKVYRGSIAEPQEDYLVDNTPLAGHYYHQGIELTIDKHGNGTIKWACPSKDSCTATFAPMTSEADPLWVGIKSSDYSGPVDMSNLYTFDTAYQLGVKKGSTVGTIEFYGASADDAGLVRPLCGDTAPAYFCGGGA